MQRSSARLGYDGFKLKYVLFYICISPAPQIVFSLFCFAQYILVPIRQTEITNRAHQNI